MDYTDITKADIQEKLDAMGVKYTTRDTKDDLIAKLEAGNDKKEVETGAEPTNEPEVEPEQAEVKKEASASGGQFELAKNVKYRGVYYKAGESIKLDESDVEYFTNKKLIK